MTPEESNIIREIFARVRASGIPNDPQARAAIDAELRANPDAGLGLVQMLVALDHQRSQLAAERDQLAAQLNATQRPASSGLFGSSVPSYAPPPQPAGPWGQQQPPAPPQAAQPWGAAQQPVAPGGSFLRTALGSAAGMAGGLFAFEALKGVFGGHQQGGLFGSSFSNPTEVIRETTYIDDRSGGYGANQGSGFDTSSDDGSIFAGGSDDDSSFG